MKKLLIFVFCFIFLDSVQVQAQNRPQKMWQIMFDWGGYRDDFRSLIVDDDNNYVAGGAKIDNSIMKSRAALAKITSWGEVIWKWTCERETTDISPFGMVMNSGNIMVMIRSNNPPYQVYQFYHGNVINKKDINKLLAMKRSNGVILGAESGLYPKIYIYDNNLETIQSFIYHSYAINIGGLDITNKIFICGTDYSSTGQWNVALYAKMFDSTGNQLWYYKVNDVSRANGIMNKTGSVYITYTEPLGRDFVTVKINDSGEEMWKRRWNGYPRYNTREVSWVDRVIEYPTGGCVAIGSLGKDSVPDPSQIWNWTDFGIVAYDSLGNELWSIRDQAQPGWVRNDLWDGAWDKENYLITAGVARQYDEGKRYVVVQKWFVPGVTSVEDKPNPNPENYELYQNYPNPFNSTTTIRFTIPHRLNVTLKVFDVLGKEVATLVNEEKNPGNYEVKFDASNLPTGVYFYQLQAGGEFIETKKMILMK